MRETESFQALVEQTRELATPDGFRGCFRVTIDRPSLVAKLGVIRAPTLILVGERDTHYLAESELMEHRIPDARRVVMPNVGHPMTAQDPEAFETQVMAFLSGQERCLYK